MSIGNLWSDSQWEVIDGTVTFPQDISAGTSLGMTVVAHKTRKKDLVRWEVQLDWIFTPPEVKPLTDLPGLYYRGEQMSQFFKPPRPSNRRNKILIWGPSGTGKTTLALQFPACAYIDNHGSVEKYESAYPDHLFARPRTADDTMSAVASLMKDPAGRKTLVLDDITTHWVQVQEKWADTFLKRLPKSKGHHAEFYTFQPSDWIHPKRDLKSMVLRMIALDMNVICIARATKEYSGTGEEFMKVLGETFAGEKGLPYEFDFIFELRHQGDKRIAVTHKQRIAPGSKPLPDQLEFTIDDHGRATFYDFFKDFSVPEHLTKEAHVVEDPVSELQPGPVDTPPPVSPGPPTDLRHIDFQKPATNEQFSQIKDLKDQLAYGNGGWGVFLMKEFKVQTAKSLNTQDAGRLIGLLQQQLDDIPF